MDFRLRRVDHENKLFRHKLLQQSSEVNMTKRNSLNNYLIALGILAPILKCVGYLMAFVNRPVQGLLAILLFFGAAPAGCIALLTVLFINRKNLKSFGWMILLPFLALDFLMIAPMNIPFLFHSRRTEQAETEEVQGKITVNLPPYEDLNHSTIDEDEYVLDKLTDHFILNVQQ